MSDATVLAASTLGVALIGMLTTIIVLLIGNKNAKEIRKELRDTNHKVDEYHKETNSKLTRLVEVEKKVSYSEGEKQGKADQIISGGSQPIVNYDKEKPEEKTSGTGVKKNLDQAKGKIDEAKKKLDDL